MGKYVGAHPGDVGFGAADAGGDAKGHRGKRQVARTILFNEG
jgi:hypothetical protein